MALEIKDSNFEELSQNNELLVVDFWAPWCGPCKQIAPYVEELAKEYEGKLYYKRRICSEGTASFLFHSGELYVKAYLRLPVCRLARCN